MKHSAFPLFPRVADSPAADMARTRAHRKEHELWVGSREPRRSDRSHCAEGHTRRSPSVFSCAASLQANGANAPMQYRQNVGCEHLARIARIDLRPVITDQNQSRGA